MPVKSCRYFVVGFPSRYASTLIEKLIAEDEGPICFLCPRTLIPAAKLWVNRYRKKGNVEIIEGEPFFLDFGMDGKKWTRITESVEYIFNFYAPFNHPERLSSTINGIIEIAQHSPKLKKVVVMSIFSRNNGKEEKENLSSWSRCAAVMENVISMHRFSIPWIITKCGIPLLSSSTFISPVSGIALEYLLEILVFLNCQVDMKVLKKIRNRYIPFTPVENFTEWIVNTAVSQNFNQQIVEFYYNDGINIDFIISILNGVLPYRKINGMDFPTACRKFAHGFIKKITGETTPYAIMEFASLNNFKCSEIRFSNTSLPEISLPSLGNLLPSALEASMKTIEEIVRIESKKEDVSDNLE